MPTKQDKLHARALELYQSGNLDQALVIYKQLFSRNKSDAQAWHMASAIAGMTGDYVAAKTYSEKAVRLAPDAHGPCVNLANILQISGDLHGAMKQFKRALALKPDDPQTLASIAMLNASLGELSLAENQLQDVISRHPRFAEAYNALGNIYRETARPDMAAACLQQAVKIRPDYVDALCNLGAILSEQLKFEAAGACYTAALQVQPGNPATLLGYGNLHQSMGEFDKARQCYLDALNSNPADPAIQSSLAALHERCGEREAARELLSPLIGSQKFSSDAAITYARLCQDSSEREQAIRALRACLDSPQSPGKQIDIYFALGDLYDQQREYETAFDCYRQANELDIKLTPMPDYSSFFRPIYEFYSAQQANNLPASSNKSELPVFIVGMPRTGTSLVEQILASHPEVSAGGERSDIFSLIDSLKPETDKSMSFIDTIGKMTAGSLDELADKHLQVIETLADGRSRFTDKTPLHGLLLGFISQLLPGSRVIICNRDPVDTCLSIYFHHFNAFHGYARQLETLGAFFSEYYRLMDHWVNTLDIKLLEVGYEDLVRNPDDTIHSIISFCGLDWHDDCLSFHKNKRVVNTPSYNQVRKPIYTSSLNRGEHYNKHIEPLRTALGGR